MSPHRLAQHKAALVMWGFMLGGVGYVYFPLVRLGIQVGSAVAILIAIYGIALDEFERKP
jgi:hypothetical protein